MSPFTVELQAWIAAEFGVDGLTADTPLFSSQILDSLALVDLLDQVEQRAGLQVAWSDVTLDHFDTLARIEAYVAARRTGT